MEFKSIEEAVKKLTAEQALKDLNAGFKQRMYRKERNGKQQELLGAIAASPELKKRIEQEIAAKAKKTA